MSLDSILRATGKNLFDCGKNSDYNFPIQQFNLTISNNTMSGVVLGTGNSGIVNTKHYISSGTYTFSSIISGTDTPNYRYLIRPYNSNHQIITNLTISGWTYNQWYKAYIPNSSAQVKTFTIPDTVSYWQYGLAFLGTTGETVTYSNIQLEEGSTATAYEPYEYLGPKTIKMSSNSKNLIPYPYATASKTISGVTFTVQEDGGIKVEGTPNNPVSMFYISTPANTISALKIGNTYTLSGYRSGSGATLFYKNTEVSDSYTFTCDAQNPLIGIKVVQGTTADALFYPQLEEGSVATEYELNTGSKEVLKVSYNSKNFFDKTNYSVQSHNNAVRFDISKLKIGEQYTISSNLPLYWIKISNSSDGWNSVQQTSSTGIYNYTFIMQRNPNIPASATTQYLFLGIENGKMITDINAIVDYNIQVELGDKATDYVPYFNTVVWTKKA